MPILESKLDHAAIPRNLLAGTWGIVLGLFFGVPPAWAATGMGLPWMPYGTAVIIVGLMAGLLIAFTVEALFPRPGEEEAPSALPQLRIDALAPKSTKNPAAAIRQRLAEEKANLDRLDDQRQRLMGSGYGKAVEERIVWNELLELELQDVDDQIRLTRSPESVESDSLPSKGGGH